MAADGIQPGGGAFEGSKEHPESLVSEALSQDPYPYFAMIQRDDPVHWNPRHRAWLLTRHDDVQTACRDGQRLSSDSLGPFFTDRLTETQQRDLEGSFDILRRWMVFQDPPEHTRLRMVVHKTFTPGRIEQLRGLVHETVEGLLDDIVSELDQHPESGVDLRRRFAYLLPTTITLGMLGIDVGLRDQFQSWAEDLGALINGAVDQPDRARRANDAVKGMVEIIEEHMLSAGANDADTLLAALARAEEDGQRLTHTEVLATATLLVDAGFKNTVNLISNGLATLLSNPEQLELLRRDGDLITSAVDELVRFDGPAKLIVRFARGDFELRGKPIRKGDRVFLVAAAANRDPEVFDHPSQLDLARNAGSGMAFGHGIHFCLGQALARMQGQVAIGAAVRRLGDVVLSRPLRWDRTIVTRSVESVVVTRRPMQVAQ